MKLLHFPERLETRPGYPCRAFRWTLEVSRVEGLWLSLVHQYDLNGWYDSHTLRVDLGLRPSFKIEQDHIYYDGPHCSYQVGPFVLQTGGNPFRGWDCPKCWGEDG